MMQRSKDYRNYVLRGINTKLDPKFELEIRIEVIRQRLDMTKIEIDDDDYAKHLKLTPLDRNCILLHDITAKYNNCNLDY